MLLRDFELELLLDLLEELVALDVELLLELEL